MSAHPAEVYAAALRGRRCRAHGLCAQPVNVPVHSWTGPADAADRSMLGRCTGPTLDIGCGPGRLTYALALAGQPALGIDVVPEAVHLARARGATAMTRNVFARLPGEGRWRCALLADGNIGIGGDPVRLLRRTRSLLGAGGVVVCDLAPPGTGLRTCAVNLEADGMYSRTFPWSLVAPEALAAVAAAAALETVRMEICHGRWIAELQARPGGR